jgi:hypothetical protein
LTSKLRTTLIEILFREADFSGSNALPDGLEVHRLALNVGACNKGFTEYVFIIKADFTGRYASNRFNRYWGT